MDRQNGEGAPIEKPKMAKRTSVQPWNAPKKSSPARTPQQATAVKQSVMAHSPLASNANAARSKALADNDRVKALQAEWEEKEGAAKEKVAAERKKLADLEEKKRAQELERQAKTKAWNEELSKSQAEAQKQKLAKSRAEAQKRKQPQTDFQRAQNHYPSSVSEWSGVSSSEEEESEEEEDDGDDASDVGQAVFKPGQSLPLDGLVGSAQKDKAGTNMNVSAVTSSTPLPSQKTAAASPIPLPSYAQNLSHKRSLAEMSNGDSSSEPPQKLTEKKTSPRPEPVTTEMPKSLAADTAAKPPASTAPTPAVEKLADTDLPALIRSDVGTATSASSSPAPLPTKVDLHVYVNGEKLDVLDKVEDGSRMYTQYFSTSLETQDEAGRRLTGLISRSPGKTRAESRSADPDGLRTLRRRDRGCAVHLSRARMPEEDGHYEGVRRSFFISTLQVCLQRQP